LIFIQAAPLNGGFRKMKQQRNQILLGIYPSTWQLLRFHFSFFLMPVFWFALTQIIHIDWLKATLIFFILHFLVYPSSNGYNSYMDKDQSSIGGLKNPPQPSVQLFQVSVIMDSMAILLGLLISLYFSAGILAYILASRAYSYRGIRLKKFPILGYLTVVLFQGAVCFWLVYYGASSGRSVQVPELPMIASALLVGGFYPLTQVYQHHEDLKDGVKSMSALLGIRGTFIFSMTIYVLAFLVLAYIFISALEQNEFFVLATCMLPIIVYFLIWAVRTWKFPGEANFENTMKMNIIASSCTNLGFIVVLFMK
jgi:1,4-dihydroxy-2-naphthoate octaprenyltransferase